MPKMVCRSCTYSEQMTEREAEFGGMCPRCHSYLSHEIKIRPGRAMLLLRPLTVRSLIAAPICFLVGALLIASSHDKLGDRGVVFWGRVFLLGILLLVAGVGCLVTGLAGLRRDLSGD